MVTNFWCEYIDKYASIVSTISTYSNVIIVLTINVYLSMYLYYLTSYISAELQVRK